MVRGLVKEGPGLDGWPLRPVILVTLAVVTFGLVTPVLGYAIAGLLLLLISGLAARDVRFPALLVALGRSHRGERRALQLRAEADDAGSDPALGKLLIPWS